MVALPFPTSRLKRIPVAHVLAAWLKAEYTSSRFGPRLRRRMKLRGIAKHVIANPKLGNAHQNRLRADAMEHRGYKSKTRLFTDFPTGVRWYVTRITPQELLKHVIYINDQSWTVVAGRSRQPLKAVTKVKRSRSPSFMWMVKMAKRITSKFAPPPIIIATDGKKNIVMEGHGRLTALAIAATHDPDCLPASIPIMIGYSKQLHRWRFY